MSFGPMHSILCTMFLHDRQCPFWKGHQSVQGHKCMLLYSMLIIIKGNLFVF
jgi:hypothetical protein